MKKVLFIFFPLLFSLITHAQTWVPVGNGVTGYVNTLFVYDSVMYVGGRFAWPGNNIAQWNGLNWDSTGIGTNGSVYAIQNYEGLVYLGGLFTTAGGHSAGNIATWNGKSFDGLGLRFEGGRYGLGSVNVFSVYDSLLFIGGQYDSINHHSYAGLTSWNGQKIDSVYRNKYIPDYWYNTSILTIYRDSLLIGFAYGGSDIPIFTWNNHTNQQYLGNNYFYASQTFSNVNMNAFCTIDSNLYMGGSFLYFEDQSSFPYKKDTVNNIAMWNGKTWSAVGSGINGTIYALASYNNMLVAGGSFDTAGGVPVNNIALWNGTTWAPLGKGINGPVYTLAVFQGDLYAGGDFNSPGVGIVEYTYPTTKMVNNDSVNVFPNPNNGQFTVVCNRAITAGNQPLLEIYNNLGQKIYSANLTDGNNLIDIGKQAKGVYIYKITSSGNNLINPGKFVVE